GAPIVDLDTYKSRWNESFQFTWVAVEELTPAEREVDDQTDAILALRGGRPERLREIAISSTMRLGSSGYAEAAGLWEPKQHRIVIKRTELRTLETYAGTLLHEVAHAVSGTPDVSAGFEDALTAETGSVAATAIGE
ncbi:MAG: ATP-binding protein, partial [Chloroflexota bacterium]